MLLREGVWKLTLFDATVVWKALWSLIAFAALAGLGSANARARETRAAEARAQRAETLRAEARLAVLRAQLNPHFILNVLHSLVGLAQRDPTLTATALERLGTTLRYALRVQSRAVDTVPLRDELAFTLDYLELERLRLGGRLETRLAIADALLDRTVPSFVLQPLVENSIRHAIAPRSRGGVVAIAVEECNGGLSLRVDDDGSAAASNGAQPWRADAGVGLRLLRDRLDALYGAGAVLEVGPSPLGGFRAVIHIDAAAVQRAGEAE
jgi:LytS/YehU family sensor histidine kinase